MTPDEVRQIVRDELSSFMLTDRFYFASNLQIRDGINVILSGTTGTKIGTAATQKLGFFGATPVVRQNSIAAPSGGTTVDSQARTAIASIIAEIKSLGLTA